MLRNISITLDDHFDQFVSAKIRQGRFQSVGEVVRAGLRTLEENESKLDALRAKLQAGENSPVAGNFNGEEFMKSMHKMHVK